MIKESMVWREEPNRLAPAGYWVSRKTAHRGNSVSEKVMVGRAAQAESGYVHQDSGFVMAANIGEQYVD